MVTNNYNESGRGAGPPHRGGAGPPHRGAASEYHNLQYEYHRGGAGLVSSGAVGRTRSQDENDEKMLEFERTAGDYFNMNMTQEVVKLWSEREAMDEIIQNWHDQLLVQASGKGEVTLTEESESLTVARVGQRRLGVSHNILQS